VIVVGVAFNVVVGIAGMGGGERAGVFVAFATVGGE
jgi:hypothetical protein